MPPIFWKGYKFMILKTTFYDNTYTNLLTTFFKQKQMTLSTFFNVNEEKFSPETENIATSLKKEFHKEFQREDIITKFIEILENNIIEEIEL